MNISSHVCVWMTTYYCLLLLAQVLATVLTLKRLANLRLLFLSQSLLPSVVPGCITFIHFISKDQSSVFLRMELIDVVFRLICKKDIPFVSYVVVHSGRSYEFLNTIQGDCFNTQLVYLLL